MALVASLAGRGDDGDDDSTTAPTAATTETTPTTADVGAPDDPFAGLVGGSTDGDAAVAQLRAAGFVVFDYDVCSDSVPSPGLLRQVRLTETGAEVVGIDGPTELAERVEAPSELDVLITTGSPCG